MKRWQKLVSVPVLVAAVAFGVMAPTAVSADTDRVTDRATDRVSDLRPTDVRSDVLEEGRVELREPRTLEARGRGNVALAGRLKMTGIAYGHSLTIIDHAGDAEIRVSAREHVRNDDGSITYRGLNGELAISGSEIVVKFHRVGIHFEATGNGRAELDGYGWFKLDGGRPHRWRAF
jgi:hypothetical protein